MVQLIRPHNSRCRPTGRSSGSVLGRGSLARGSAVPERMLSPHCCTSSDRSAVPCDELGVLRRPLKLSLPLLARQHPHMGCTALNTRQIESMRGSERASERERRGCRGSCLKILHGRLPASLTTPAQPDPSLSPSPPPPAFSTQILGVATDADDATLKKAYRKGALKWHPGAHRRRLLYYPCCPSCPRSYRQPCRGSCFREFG